MSILSILFKEKSKIKVTKLINTLKNFRVKYGKVAYFELSSHQISEPKQQATRENIHLAKISEMLAN